MLLLSRSLVLTSCLLVSVQLVNSFAPQTNHVAISSLTRGGHAWKYKTNPPVRLPKTSQKVKGDGESPFDGYLGSIDKKKDDDDASSRSLNKSLDALKGAVDVLAAAAAAEASLSGKEAETPLPSFPSKSTMEKIKKLPRSEPFIAGNIPSVGKILSFAALAVGYWLTSPILALVDTNAVGSLPGTIQLAALGQAMAVTNYASLLVAFMYTATTNLVATAQEADKGVEGKPRTARTLISALRLSGFIGLGLGGVLMVFAKQLLQATLGNSVLDPKVFSAATKYIRIRALGMPAAAVIGAAQAGCIGMQDISSPLFILAITAAVNVVGDFFFVGMGSPLLGGAAGVAWASVISQFAALALFLKLFCDKPDEAPDKPNSVKGFLKGRFNPKDLLAEPSAEAVSQFTPFALPVTTMQVGRVSSYLAMSHVVSTSLSSASMAAQQVILSLLYFLYPAADSLSLTAQSFVPSIVQKMKSKERANTLWETSLNFLKAGMVFSTVMVGVVGLTLSRSFTSDPVVGAIVSKVTPLLLGVFAVHGTLCAAEGVLLGQKDLGFLGKTYAVVLAAVPWLMLRVKKAALAGNRNANLAAVWKVFLSYQICRVLAWVGRLFMLQKQTDEEALALSN